MLSHVFFFSSRNLRPVKISTETSIYEITTSSKARLLYSGVALLLLANTAAGALSQVPVGGPIVPNVAFGTTWMVALNLCGDVHTVQVVVCSP